MTRCSWRDCAVELTMGEVHTDHELWAADPTYEYYAVRQGDGSVDVYRRPRGTGKVPP